jgi:hypothetical protein
VKWLRFSIFDLMLLVALAAADLVLWRLFTAANFHPRAFADLFIVGTLPMANLLVLGIVRLTRARSRDDAARRFWAGFETFGGVAILLFLVSSVLAGNALHKAIDDTVQPLVRLGVPIVAVILPALLVPQLAFALFGGWIGRSFRPVSSRRVDDSTFMID